MQVNLLKKHQSGFWTTLVMLAIMISIAGAQETKWIKVGQLHNWYQASGSEPETARRGLVSDQQDGLRWPARYNNQDCQAAKGLWMAATNYNDAVANRVFAHKVVHVGPRVWDDANEMMPIDFRMIARFERPTVIVDGRPASLISAEDLVNEIDPNQKADRVIISKVRSSMGLEMTRKIYAFSQQYHDNYHIFEYTFKNNGVVDLNGTQNPQDLTGVRFLWQFRWSASKEMGAYGNFFMPQSATWGHNTMNDVRGEIPGNGDPFRAVYAWHGRHSGSEVDNIGAPAYLTDGHLAAPQFMGSVVIHADRSVTDRSDDPLQPSTTQYQGSDEPFQSANNQYNPADMTVEYGVMSAGHADVRHADAVGYCADCNADEFGGTGGGFSSTQGFGPYDIPSGDSIRIVVAEGISGLGWDKRYEVGENWQENRGLSSPAALPLPNGGTSTDPDLYKEEWVYTGRDSLFQTFERAIGNYNANFDIPQPPPPPDLFNVQSQGDRIYLTWSSNAESSPGFAGYRLYRSEIFRDTTYTRIFECGQGTANPTVVNEFSDTSAVRGIAYYYYVTAFDDGSNNTGTLNPGGSLESSGFYTQTNLPARLKRPPGTALDQIRVVPNPWNIRSRDLQYGTGNEQNRIFFFEVPPFCIVKIFTERGDLIQTIEHTDGSGDIPWDLETTSRQILVSGVYIAYFEVTEDVPDPQNPGSFRFRKGDNTFRKFVVIR